MLYPVLAIKKAAILVLHLISIDITTRNLIVVKTGIHYPAMPLGCVIIAVGDSVGAMAG